MRKLTWIWIAALLMIAGPASADVIIHFVSGKTLPARAVRYVDDMVQVDLGADGTIAFPRDAIEKVEVPDRSLRLGTNTAKSGARSGPMIAGGTAKAGQSSAGVKKVPRPRPNPGVPATTRQQIDRNGFAVTNAVPMARGYAATRLKTVVLPDPHAARNNNVVGGTSLRGTQFSGGRYVMASDQVPTRPKAVPIQLVGQAPPQPEPTDTDTDTDAGGNGSDN